MVAARVLDIHRYVQPYAVTILVEYVSENTTLGSRSRRVIELSLNEMTTMIRNEEYSAKKSKDEFLESLTPIEIQTAALAKKMKMTLYGFTEIGRSVGQDTDYAVNTPLKAMSNNGWVAIKASIEREFGSMDSLLSAQEHADKEFNFIDAFSRLKPSFVMKRFNSKNLDYVWVITEDGQLKIIPYLNEGHNLKVATLRLASGRRVYAGGSFKIRHDGSIALTLNSLNYQKSDASQGSYDAFKTRNLGIEDFIKAVFSSQAQTTISEISARKTYSYTVDPQYRDYDPYFKDPGNNGDSRHQKTYEDDPQDIFNFLNSLQKDAAKRAPELSWNRKTDYPLSFKDWSQKIGANDPHQTEAYKQRWAHYVLGTKPDMKMEEITKQHRLLSSQFHPDKNKSPQAVDVMRSINTARDTLRKIFN